MLKMVVRSAITVYLKNRQLLLFVFARQSHNLEQATIYRRLRIGRDGHFDQSEAYDIPKRVRVYWP